MMQKFIENKYEIVDFSEKSDIYIINTCTVTNMSDRKSRQVIRRTKELNNKAITVAVGCYAQVAKEEIEKLEEIDLVLGNTEKKDIVAHIEEFINNKIEQEQKDIMKETEFLDFGTITYTEKTRATIKIQDGCDRYCSYCIIPYARGRVRSRDEKSIINEIKSIVNNGIKEVVLTGIHITSYGKDFKNENGLIDLLEKIDEINGLERIRLGSLEPTLITKDFVNRLKNIKKICNHFHLSLQSGCNETLKRMNRRYTTEEFENGIKLLREAFKDVILTTDIIVGFPGETEEEFKITYNYLEKINFYKMHVFKYSQRKGTKAANMPNQISPSIKEERSKKLIELSNENEKVYLEKYIGSKVEVLFEEKDGECYKGHTTNYIVVKAKGEILENTIKMVKIEKRNNMELIGKM